MKGKSVICIPIESMNFLPVCTLPLAFTLSPAFLRDILFSLLKPNTNRRLHDNNQSAMI